MSRATLALLASTTVHYVWTAEMTKLPLPPGVGERIQEVLGGSPGGSSQPSRGACWVCPYCGHEEDQPGGVNAVIHPCPRRKGERVSLQRKTG